MAIRLTYTVQIEVQLNCRTQCQLKSMSRIVSVYNILAYGRRFHTHNAFTLIFFRQLAHANISNKHSRLELGDSLEYIHYRDSKNTITRR